MSYRFVVTAGRGSVPITAVDKAGLAAWKRRQPASLRCWVESAGFTAEPGSVSLVAGADGRLQRVLVGVERGNGLWSYAGLPERLPAGTYRIDARLSPEAASEAALGWALGCYRFDRYKSRRNGKPIPALAWPEGADRAAVKRAADATFLVRDLINTPAEDMHPGVLADEARRLARRHCASVRVIVGNALLRANYPAIHAVGRASAHAPRLIDLRWGRPRAPKVTLVGKGVCFDSGGLDLKTASGMIRMKKDMGGAAHALGLAHMIMEAGLDVSLRVLIPAVENAVSGNAYRPADVIRTRKGITVEVGNTDAEGRLILCDALAEADREKPAFLADFATLTGAARTAVGNEIAALFCNDDALASDLLAAGEATGDPLWRLPLWKPYRRLLDSKVADICNVSEGPAGGAITAALYLNEFISATTPWIHLDIMAWNMAARPGRPAGGEAMGMRALFAVLARRFAAGRRR